MVWEARQAEEHASSSALLEDLADRLRGNASHDLQAARDLAFKEETGMEFGSRELQPAHMSKTQAGELQITPIIEARPDIAYCDAWPMLLRRS